ncbi:MAG: diguanylate cyclase [Planctomycetota bacterium]|nr:MAG: diguanylate cyclase [Planctomycetota bacterium]
MRPRPATIGFWMAILGLAAVAAALTPSLLDTASEEPGVSLGLVLAGCALTLLGLGLIARTERTPPLGANLRPNEPPVAIRAAPQNAASTQSPAVLHDACLTFLDWLDEAPRDATVWPALDQLIRETLHNGLRAARVRSFRVDSQGGALSPLRTDAADAGAPAPDEGLFGHVVATGRAFLAPQTRPGDLLAELAEREPDEWDIVWPVRREGRCVGVIACGSVDWTERSVSEAQALLRLLQSFWLHIADRVALYEAETRDKTTGVLTRADLFRAAETAMTDSHAAGEPVVAAIVAIEGLRGLDDTGRWRQRDALLERLGDVIRRRIRSDDIVGRFSDERFAVVLRRLDLGLGRLIMEKLLDAIDGHIGALDADLRCGVHVRAGLSASGLRKRSAAELLAAALAAGDAARRENLRLGIEPQRGADAKQASRS